MGDMGAVRRWRASGHLERAVETAGGQEAFEASLRQMLNEADSWRLAVWDQMSPCSSAHLAKSPGPNGKR